jgi:histidinol-phosphatase
MSDLEFALGLADVADEIAMRYFRSRTLEVHTKPDLTPVTQADREVEEALRARIGTERRSAAILGEELGQHGSGSLRWILDPIDGTRNFVRGIPVFATLIALERAGEVELGVVSAPALHRRWWALRGEGARLNGERIHVSGVTRVEDAVVAYTSAHSFFAHGLGEPFVSLAERSWTARGVGDFWQHVLVAEGAVDLAVELEVSPWDLAAVQVVVEEAGGRFTDVTGVRRIDGGSAVSSNGHLHEEGLRSFGPSSG